MFPEDEAQLIALAQQKLSEIRPRIGVQASLVNGRITVVRLYPDGPAVIAGVELGDEIITVNGSHCYTIKDFHDIVQTLQPGQECTMTVIRGTLALDHIIRVGAQVWPSQFTILTRIANGKVNWGDSERVCNVITQTDAAYAWSSPKT
jgi:predicted metalloprotease with PDZ domain